MKKAIVIARAKSLASGMNEQGIKVDCVNVEDVQIDKLSEYDLLAIGGPTHGFGMSKPMKEFIEKLKHVGARASMHPVLRARRQP
jgi:flavodoxin